MKLLHFPKLMLRRFNPQLVMLLAAVCFGVLCRTDAATTCQSCAGDIFSGSGDLFMIGSGNASVSVGGSVSGGQIHHVDNLNLPIDADGNIALTLTVNADGATTTSVGCFTVNTCSLPPTLVLPVGQVEFSFYTDLIPADCNPYTNDPACDSYTLNIDHENIGTQTVNFKAQVRCGSSSDNDAGSSTSPGAVPSTGGSFTDVPPTSVNVTSSYSLGRTDSGNSAGRVSINVDVSNSSTVSPSSLTLSTSDTTVKSFTDATTGALLQAKSSQAILNFTSPSGGGVQIQFFDAAGATGAGDTPYTPAGSVLKTTLVVPVTTTIGSTTVPGVRFTTTNATDGSVEVYDYYALADTHGGISRTVHNGHIVDITEAPTISGTAITGKITDTIQKTVNQDNQEIFESERVETYLVQPWGLSLDSAQDDPSGRNRTTSYKYYDSVATTSPAYGRLHIQLNSDGSWTRNVIDPDSGRLTAVYRPWIGSPTDMTPIAALTENDCDAQVYTYNPWDGTVASTTHKIMGVTVSITTSGQVWAMDYSTGQPMMQTVTQVYAADGTLLTQQITGNALSNSDLGTGATVSSQGDMVYSRNADGTTTHYSKTQAMVAGDPLLHTTTTAVQGTVTSPDGLPRQSLQTVSESSAAGLVLETTNVALGGGAFAPMQSRTVVHTLGAQPQDEYRLDGTTTGTTKQLSTTSVETTDEVGVTSQTETDPSGFVKTQTRKGITGSTTVPTLDLVVTTSKMALDAGAGYKLQTQRTGDDGASVSIKTFNGLGEVTYEQNADATQAWWHTYADTSLAGRTVTDAFGTSDNVVKVTTYFPNGLLNSITGSSVVAEYHTYSMDPGTGNRLETVHYGASDSARWRRTTTDAAAHVVKQELPAPEGQGVMATTNVYNSKSQLIKTINPINPSGENAPTLYQYDESGRLFRQGVDLNNNGILDVNSNEPITEYLHNYEQVNGSWWEVNRTRVYCVDGTSQCRETETRRQLGAGVNNAVVTIQKPGVTTTQSVSINRTTKQKVTTTTRSDAQYPGIRTEQNGLLISESAPGGPVAGGASALTSYAFDSRWRLSQTTPPDLGGSEGSKSIAYTYDDCDRILTETSNDASPAIQNTYTYYPAGHSLGGKLWKKLGRPTRYAAASPTYYFYDAKGNLTHQWGTGTNPVAYFFDDYGQMVDMVTSTSDPTVSTDPTAVTSAPFGTENSPTLWTRDAGTGLITNKVGTAQYHYRADGTLSQRISARGITTGYFSDALKRTYAITYSDSTPGVTYEYHRNGSPAAIMDAAGFHHFYQDPATGQVASEVIGASLIDPPSNIDLLAGIEIDHGYDGSGRVSRLSAQQNSHPLFPAVNIGYGTTGQVASISSGNLNVAYASSVTGTSTQLAVTRTTVPAYSGAEVDSVDVVQTGLGHCSTTHGPPDASFSFGGPVGGPGGSGSEAWDMSTMNGLWRYKMNSRGEITRGIRVDWVDPPPLYPSHSQPNLLDGWGKEYVSYANGDRHYMYDGFQWSTNTYVTGSGTTSYTYGGSPSIANSPYLYVRGQGEITQVYSPTGAGGVTVNGLKSTPYPYMLYQANHKRPKVQLPLMYFSAQLQPTGSSQWIPVTVQAASTNVSATLTTPITRTGYYYKPPATEGLSYDADGNLSGDGRWVYTWDGENRLIQMTTQTSAVTNGVPNLRLTFAYDAQSRRIRKMVEKSTDGGTTWTASTDTRFVYDGWNLIAEIETMSGAADTPPGMSTPYVRRSYLWGPDMSGSWQGAGGVGGLLAMRRSAHGHATASTWWTHWDSSGNIVGMSEVVSSGTPRLASYEYDAYGVDMVVNEPEEDLNPFRFSTKYVDVESDLYYYGYRYYEPRRGRWLSKDPIGEDGGVNLYAFCDNNPINGIDYLGEKTVFNNARVTGFNYEDNDPKNSDRTVTGRYRVDKKKPVYGYKSGKPNYKPNKKHKTPTNYETGLGYYRADLTAATYDDPSTLAVSKAVLDKCPYGSKVWIPEIGWFVVESFAGAGSADDPRFDLWMATASRSSFYSIDGRYCVTCYARGETPAESDSQPGPKWSRYKDWVNASRIDMYRDLDKWMGVYVDGVLTGYEPPKE